MQKYIYGRTGETTAKLHQRSGAVRFEGYELGIQRRQGDGPARQGRLEAGPDGIRAKDGKKLEYVFQTSINQPRQQTQEIIKAACKQAGINIKIKAVLASVYFSSDVGNPDTYTKFYADLQMYTTQPGRPDPGTVDAILPVHRDRRQGQQMVRPQHHPLAQCGITTRPGMQSDRELDPMKRAALLIKCNDMVVNDVVVIPGSSVWRVRPWRRTCMRR